MPRALTILVVACAAACGGEVRVAAPALAPTGPAPAPLVEDVYVWQRAWTRDVEEAVATHGPTFDGVRALAAELEGEKTVVVDAKAALAGRPVVAVIRADGAKPPSVEAVRAAIHVVLAKNPGVVGVELDHDCASSKLATYAKVLRAVRGDVGGRTLSITALPSWTPAPDLDDVLAAVDEVVLQVHSVDKPERGIFTSAKARADLDAFASRVARTRAMAVRVALPAYGHALAVDDKGQVVRVASEEHKDVGANVSWREVWAEPREVSVFLRELRASPPPGVRGVVWFRLPVAGDRRSWSSSTLTRVRKGEPLERRVRVEREGKDVIVVNDGDGDERAPDRAVPDVVVAAADGVGGYAWDGSAFVSSSPPRLVPGERKVIGWVLEAHGAKEMGDAQ
jgi:hypothetical protein